MAEKKKTGTLKAGVDELLAKQPSSEAEKDAYIRELQSTLMDVTGEIEELKEMVIWLRKQMYGSKSEQTHGGCGKE